MFKRGSFPTLKQIQHFEGINGPDGLKTKSPGEHEPSHLYDPTTKSGDILGYIDTHYQELAVALKSRDLVRAAFEASWLAHTITDGLTPAHQFPLDEVMAELRVGSVEPDNYSFRHKGMVRGEDFSDSLRRNWAMWGKKGILSTHINFEIGVAATLWLFNIRTELSRDKLNQALELGPVKFFQLEAAAVYELKLYDYFQQKGWNARIGQKVRYQLAPLTTETIAIVWLLAYIKAGLIKIDDKVLTRANLAQI